MIDILQFFYSQEPSKLRGTLTLQSLRDFPIYLWVTDEVFIQQFYSLSALLLRLLYSIPTPNSFLNPRVEALALLSAQESLLGTARNLIMAIEIGQPAGLSKVAVSETHGEDSPYFAGWKAYDEDPYDESSNSSGVIQMGLAENQVSSPGRTIYQANHLRFYILDLVKSFSLELMYVLFLFYQVSFDLLEEYLEQNSEASSWGEGARGFRENALFQDYHGLKSFRQVPFLLTS